MDPNIFNDSKSLPVSLKVCFLIYSLYFYFLKSSFQQWTGRPHVAPVTNPCSPHPPSEEKIVKHIVWQIFVFVFVSAYISPNIYICICILPLLSKRIYSYSCSPFILIPNIFVFVFVWDLEIECVVKFYRAQSHNFKLLFRYRYLFRLSLL